MKHLWPALKIFLALTALTGIVYPLAITGISKLFFPEKAEGSLIDIHGREVGSSLIGQKFTDPRYFWPRPSTVDYNPLPSGGSNLGPISATLKSQVDQRRDALASALRKSADDIPRDLLFASGSGLDPHISPQAAFVQIDRVAQARGLDDASRKKLRGLAVSRVERPDGYFLGQPRVNVLLLNIDVDSAFGEIQP